MSAQEDMVERIARICAPDAWDPPFVPDPGSQKEQYYAERRRISQERARLILEAMREPTEAMVNAGAVADADGNLAADARNTWRAMIDAALPSSPGVKEG